MRRLGGWSRILSLGGPIAFAAANFLALVLLQRTVDPASFGLFGFMQVTIATGMGLVNGIFTSPLTLAVGPSSEEREPIIGSFFGGFLAFLVVALLLVAALCWAAGSSPEQLLLLCAAAFAMWLRWYLRSLSLALREQWGAAASDLVYSLTSVAVNGVWLLLAPFSIEAALWAQLLACLVSLLPLFATLAACVRSVHRASLAKFWSEFRRTGRWTTQMVVTAQIVANAHAYAIVLISGSAAYAPIALATLIFRPHGVILTGSLTYERPRMVETMHLEGPQAVARDVFQMRLALAGVWLANVAAAALLILFLQDQLLADQYDPHATFLAIVLTSAVVLVRSLREPAVVALQALHASRPAAATIVVSAFVTAPLVLVTLWAGGSEPAWSLVGALSGELVSLVLANRILRERSAATGRKEATTDGEAS